MGGGGKSSRRPKPPPEPEPIPEKPKEPVSKAIRDSEKKRLANRAGHRGNITNPLGANGVNTLGQLYS